MSSSEALKLFRKIQIFLVALCLKHMGFIHSDLSMEILRYRLIGPLSHAVLTETLQAANSKVKHSMDSDTHWAPNLLLCQGSYNDVILRELSAVMMRKGCRP